MIDHLSLAVADIDRSRAFYDRVMPALGARRMQDLDEEEYQASGYGCREGEPAFWVGAARVAGPPPPVPEGQHVAFAAAGRPAVDAFYVAAIAAGAADNGGPGLRPHYHPNYYAAFVIDPDGHRLEAVCHQPA
ncbi:VOC family protein [Marinimicrococcus flavescens]|uniref:VOC family protein n=1 Tax=Marinimicrococcus flavescens TaxID=3031815 RepID=A0AAP4D6H3_9PROT|nr:VOC family protein [Marinimicrococcus flavescens]